jgi:hypothetical protein
MLNYARDLKIDENNLDVEWLEQPELAYRYGAAAAEARRKANFIHEKAKVHRSLLIKAVNEDPEGTVGKSKPTASDIESCYRADEEHQQLKQELIEAEFNAEMAELAKAEICWTRKTALENLVKLHGQQYFAGPAIPRDLQAERAAYAEKKSRDANSAVTVATPRLRRGSK